MTSFLRIEKARLLARAWRRDSRSPLSTFADSGRLVNLTETLAELEQRRAHARTKQSQIDLRRLRRYIEKGTKC